MGGSWGVACWASDEVVLLLGNDTLALGDRLPRGEPSESHRGGETEVLEGRRLAGSASDSRRDGNFEVRQLRL